MCGIAGFYGSFNGQLLEAMNARTRHRGPDDEGTLHLADVGVGLAHTRLSILDLSERGRQPMWDATNSVAITYNGEIYNYRELREELSSNGFAFRSGTDTEVLLNLYLKHGEEMLSRLNGIFAFALWDRRQRRMLAARDGFGVKPLYFAETTAGFVFASEIKALLEAESVARDLNPAAVRHYLTYLWCPAPETILKSVRKLEPGHVLTLSDGKIVSSRCFYELPYDQAIAEPSVEEAAAELRERLEKAVERQLVSDVPVGAFLSGGLDSSAVVAMAKQAGSERLQCFTIEQNDPRVEASEGPSLDLPYARKVASHLDVDLHVITVGPEMTDLLETMIYHLDEPQADLAPINVYFICKLAREHGIKVLLSGAGGDDIFSGYRRHYALGLERFWSWMPRWARRFVRGGTQLVPVSHRVGRKLRKAFEFADVDVLERTAGYFYWNHPAFLETLLADSAADGDGTIACPLTRALRRLPAEMPALNKMLYLDAKYFLADHNLNYTDKLSMAHGVEVRVPLLDPDVVAMAARLPVWMKQNGRTGKWIFKKAMEASLPESVIYRPKAGFGAPLRTWLRGELQPLVEDVLSEASLSRRGLFDPQGVRRMIELDRRGAMDAAYPTLALMSIELWCRIFLDRRTTPESAAP